MGFSSMLIRHSLVASVPGAQANVGGHLDPSGLRSQDSAKKIYAEFT
jgi:hypothetical protein